MTLWMSIGDCMEINSNGNGGYLGMANSTVLNEDMLDFSMMNELFEFFRRSILRRKCFISDADHKLARVFDVWENFPTKSMEKGAFDPKNVSAMNVVSFFIKLRFIAEIVGDGLSGAHIASISNSPIPNKLGLLCKN
jgi:hypothetical protein